MSAKIWASSRASPTGCAVSAPSPGWAAPSRSTATSIRSPGAHKTSAPARQPKEGQAMPRIVETTVFHLDELSEKARETARAWYREAAAGDDWHECVFEDFEAVCGVLGVRLKTRSVRLFGGGTRQKPCIWFSGFGSQGDGASFEGAYGFATGAPKAIRAHAPE